MLEELFKDIEQLDLSNYKEMLFNLYEDEDAYSIEVVFDNDQLIIGRDHKRYIIENLKKDYKEVLKNTGSELKAYFKDHKTKYKQFKMIAYGFVDGDLKYIKRPRKVKKDIPTFTKEDFLSFDDTRLKAWISVYLNEEGKKKYENELLELAINFNGFTKEERDQWSEILVKYFDYQQYERNI